MNAEAIHNLREKLLVRRTELTGDLDHLESELRDLSIEQDAEGGSGNHYADDGSSLGEQERIGTMKANFLEQLAQIGQALERIEDGTYGTCQRCGQSIADERLEALPYTAFCIDCQKHLERQAELFGTAHVS